MDRVHRVVWVEYGCNGYFLICADSQDINVLVWYECVWIGVLSDTQGGTSDGQIP